MGFHGGKTMWFSCLLVVFPCDWIFNEACKDKNIKQMKRYSLFYFKVIRRPVLVTFLSCLVLCLCICWSENSHRSDQEEEKSFASPVSLWYSRMREEHTSSCYLGPAHSSEQRKILELYLTGTNNSNQIDKNIADHNWPMYVRLSFGSGWQHKLIFEDGRWVPEGFFWKLPIPKFEL